MRLSLPKSWLRSIKLIVNAVDRAYIGSSANGTEPIKMDIQLTSKVIGFPQHPPPLDQMQSCRFHDLFSLLRFLE